MKLRYYLSLLILFFMLSVTAFGVFLLHSERGARWALAYIDALEFIELRYSKLDGNLWQGLAFEQLHVELEKQNILCRRCAFRWQPMALLAKTVFVSELVVDGLRVELDAQEADGKLNFSGFDEFAPLGTVVVGEFRLNDFELVLAGQSQFQLEKTVLSANYRRALLELDIKQFLWLKQSGKAKLQLHLQKALAAEAELWLNSLQGRKLANNHSELSVNCDVNFTCVGELNLSSVSPPWLEGIQQASIDGPWRFDQDVFTSQLGATLVSDDGQVAELEASANYRLSEPRFWFKQVKAKRGDSELSGELVLDWQESFFLESNFQLTHLTARSLEPWLNFDGHLSAVSVDVDVDAAFNYSAASTQLHAKALQLHVQNRSYQGSGSFALNRCDKKLCWFLQHLVLEHDKSRLKLDAAFVNAEPSAFDVDIKQLNLAWLSSNFEALALDGFLDARLHLNNKTLSVNANAEALRYDSWRFDALKLQSTLTYEDFNDRSSWASELSKLSFIVDDGSLAKARVKLALDGDWQQQQLSGKLRVLEPADRAEFAEYLKRLDFNLNVQSKDVSGHQHWALSLENLNINSPRFGRWALTQTAKFDLSEKQQTLYQACLKQRRGYASLCLNEAQFVDRQGLLNFEFSDFRLDDKSSPLAYWLNKINPDWRFQGHLNARGQLKLDEHWSARVLVQAPELALVYQQQEFEDQAAKYWRFPSAELRLGVGDQRQFWRFELLSEQNDRLFTKGTYVRPEQATSLNPASDQRSAAGLSSELELDWQSLETFELFFPELEQLNGRLVANLKVQGVLPAPELICQASVRELSFVLPSSNTELSQWQLNLNVDQEQAVLAGSGNVGKGKAEIGGHLDLRAQEFEQKLSDIQLWLKGDRLTLIDGAQLQLLSDVDMKLSGNLDGLLLDGQLEIKDSSMKLEELPASATRVSKDQEIIGVEQQKKQEIPLTLNLRLDLVDNVHFSAFGLDTEVEGQLQLSGSNNLRGVGTLELVDGTYQRYSQRLDIETGQLIFTGDLENPLIRLKAERDFTEAVVGIELSGSADEPETRLYSSPSMSNAAKLSYLLSGQPIMGEGQLAAQELHNAALTLGMSRGLESLDSAGQKLGLTSVSLESDSENTTNVALGKQVSDKLYIKYLYGLINNSAQLVMEYRLNRNLSLEAASGTSQTVDLRYRWRSKQPSDENKN
ncbi:translocation/assembly module TamB domain-containing protein [Agaribacterium haliotis]|uniref:translocation/assembly module TamB domain-containing protein n=1 Tax=Agaribacterium haliotis TaxID=2013869 RepID=UPI000BB597CE|nr:translocation/assembly module TamB domain-containing protein [Agaribacterium haliotis]